MFSLYQIAIILSLFITGAIYQTSNVIYRVGLQILLELVGAQLILLLGQNFLGLTYIIVYIGAQAIQFLFVIMMLKPLPHLAGAEQGGDERKGGSQLISNSNLMRAPYLSIFQVQMCCFFFLFPFLLTFPYFSSFLPSSEVILSEWESSALLRSKHGGGLSSVELITPNWTTSFQEQTDIESMGYMIYVSYPLILVYVGISQLLVLIGIIIILGYSSN